MSKRLPHSNKHLLHLLWFNVVGRHLRAFSTIAALRARSFYSPWAVPGVVVQGQGAAKAARISGRLQTGFQIQWQWGLLSYILLSHQYFVIFLPFSSHLCMVCCLPTPPLPLLSPKPGAMQNTLQEKVQQGDEVCAELPSPPLPVKAADPSL